MSFKLIVILGFALLSQACGGGGGGGDGDSVGTVSSQETFDQSSFEKTKFN